MGCRLDVSPCPFDLIQRKKSTTPNTPSRAISSMSVFPVRPSLSLSCSSLSPSPTPPPPSSSLRPVPSHAFARPTPAPPRDPCQQMHAYRSVRSHSYLKHFGKKEKEWIPRISRASSNGRGTIQLAQKGSLDPAKGATTTLKHTLNVPKYLRISAPSNTSAGWQKSIQSSRRRGERERYTNLSKNGRSSLTA